MVMLKPNINLKGKEGPQFVRSSLTFDASFTSNLMDDKNPAGANDIFRVFIMRPDRQKALILEVSHIDEQRGIIFSDQYNDEAKTRRQSLVERVKKIPS